VTKARRLGIIQNKKERGKRKKEKGTGGGERKEGKGREGRWIVEDSLLGEEGGEVGVKGEKNLVHGGNLLFIQTERRGRQGRGRRKEKM